MNQKHMSKALCTIAETVILMEDSLLIDRMAKRDVAENDLRNLIRDRNHKALVSIGRAISDADDELVNMEVVCSFYGELPTPERASGFIDKMIQAKKDSK